MAQLGSIWAPLISSRPSRRQFGPILTPSGLVLAHLDALLAPSWRHLGPSWVILRLSWCHLGIFLVHLGHLAALLAPSGLLLGALWDPCGSTKQEKEVEAES